MDSRDRQCPVCSASLRSSGESYSVDQLFGMWEPTQFSEATIRDHRQQSELTELYSCPRCKLEIFLPQIIATPQFYVEAYNLDGSQTGSDLSYSETKWDFDVALDDAQGLHSVLEIGCGPGYFLDRVSRVTDDVMGVEYNAKALDTARRKGYSVLDSLSVPDRSKGSFDAAFSFHVLEHVRDPLDFLRNAAAWVKPGGLVGISLPNRAGPIRFIEPCVQDMPPHHATRWQGKTLEFLAERLGWSVHRMEFEPLTDANWYYYGTYLGPYLFPAQTPLHSLGRRMCAQVLPMAFRGMFQALHLVGRASTRLLKGQAMYVAFRTPKG